MTCGLGEHSRTRQCEGGICSLASSIDLIEIASCHEGNSLRLTSGNDPILCGLNSNEDASDWAGDIIEVGTIASK